MKLLTGFIAIFFMGIAHAETAKTNQADSPEKIKEVSVKRAGSSVYKCTLENGEVTYQQRKCAGEIPAEQLKIKEFDKAKTVDAQKKLEQRLQMQQNQEAVLKQKHRENKKLAVERASTQSRQELVNAADRNSQAVKQNTDAVNDNNKQGNVYYMNPPVATPK